MNQVCNGMVQSCVPYRPEAQALTRPLVLAYMSSLLLSGQVERLDAASVEQAGEVRFYSFLSLGWGLASGTARTSHEYPAPTDTHLRDSTLHAACLCTHKTGFRHDWTASMCAQTQGQQQQQKGQTFLCL